MFFIKKNKRIYGGIQKKIIKKGAHPLTTENESNLRELLDYIVH